MTAKTALASHRAVKTDLCKDRRSEAVGTHTICSGEKTIGCVMFFFSFACPRKSLTEMPMCMAYSSTHERMTNLLFSSCQVPYEVVGRRTGDVATLYADPTLALRELNWEANKSLKEMCKCLILCATIFTAFSLAVYSVNCCCLH